jgi:hypothetical protein
MTSDISVTETIKVHCGTCGTVDHRSAYLIVDVDERPDLVSLALSAELHEQKCSACGAIGLANVPLLLFLRARKRLLFIRAPMPSPNDKTRLIGYFRRRTGTLTAERHGPVPEIDISLLAVALSPDPSTAARSMSEDLTPPPFPEPAPSTSATDDTASIPDQASGTAIATQFIALTDPVAERRLLDRHPELLANSVIEYIDNFSLRATATGEVEKAARYSSKSLLIHRCMEIGILLAFLEHANVQLPPPSDDRHIFDVYTADFLRDLADRGAEITSVEDLDVLLGRFSQSAATSNASTRSLEQTIPSEAESYLRQVIRSARAKYPYVSIQQIDDSVGILTEELEGYSGNEHSQDRAALHFEISALLRIRFSMSSARRDIDSSIEHLDRALSLVTSWSERWIFVHADRALSLLNRFEMFRDLADVDSAIDSLRLALLLTSRASPQWQLGQHQLANAFSYRFSVTGSIRDAEHEIAARERWMRLPPPTDPDTALHMRINHAVFQLRRFEEIHQLNLLFEAIYILHQAYPLLAEERDMVPVTLLSLANAYRYLYSALGLSTDLDRSISWYRKFLDSEDLRTHFSSTFLAELGDLLGKRSEISDEDDDRREAIILLSNVLYGDFGLSPFQGLRISQVLGRLHLGHGEWLDAARAFQVGIEHSALFYQAQILSTGRQAAIRQAGDLYHNAAYALAKAGFPREAIVCLENGRARELGRALIQNRTDLRDVEKKDPQAFETFRRAVDMIEFVVRTGTDLGGLENTARIRDVLSESKVMMDDSLTRIRQIPGHERFLMDPDLGEIESIEATMGGQTYVYITCVQSGGLALIVTPSDRNHAVTTEAIFFGEFTTGRLEEILIGGGEFAEFGGWLGAQRSWSLTSDASSWEMSIDLVTSALGKELMGSVVGRLLELGTDRAVLLPTGTLAVLPLHAARREGEAGPAQKHLALEDITFTYAPSLRALDAAKRVPYEQQEGKLLLVVEPQPFVAPLASAKKEANEVWWTWKGSLAAGSNGGRRIWGSDATVSEVRQALETHGVFHFIGHGRFDLDDPDGGGLLMASGGVLTVRAWVDLNLALRLAVLSACETSLVGMRNADEAVGLPAALIGAGCAGVVGSLWPVGDDSTAELMGRFYRNWRRDGMDPARALREAQRWMAGRALYAHPRHWAAFTLTGE